MRRIRRHLSGDVCSNSDSLGLEAMQISPGAGQPAPAALLIDVAALERAYFDVHPSNDDPAQQVHFGTSGHRGSSFTGSFNEAHVLAIAQAICDYRRSRDRAGPLFMGRDTHALSALAQDTALQVFAANDVTTIIQRDGGYTPTPAISHAILRHNRAASHPAADGIVITPSHNPPEDGGFKYNPPHGGPAESAVTDWIQRRANALLQQGNADVRRVSLGTARQAPSTHSEDFVAPYVDDLPNVVDIDAVREAGLSLAVDPLGGAALQYWDAIAARLRLDITIVNRRIDPTFSFMTLDHDGKIRMDCSSPYAMARLVHLKDSFRLAFGNDPDADRHGIVTPSAGLMNPNHYLAVAVDYLLGHRPQWPARAVVGKTLVSTSMIDRVVARHGHSLAEMPVGFKWFAAGLRDGSCCFGGEESAGASLLRHNGGVWTTDKDGPVMNLLAAEITARTGRDPAEHYQALTRTFGAPLYMRIDAAATPEQKRRLSRLTAAAVTATQLAGEPITAKLSRAPGNDAPIGGIKVIAANGWFAARPSGTEDIYKIYAESFKDQSHLDAIVAEAQTIVDGALGGTR
jgi:phosphoglucomutase